MLKQFVGNLRTNCFSVFDYFVKLALKGLKLDLLYQYIHNAFPKCLNQEKTIFIYINIFLSDPTLIRTPPFSLILTPLSDHAQLFGLPTYLALRIMVFKIGAFLIITRCGKMKRKLKMFGLICRGGRLCFFVGSLQSFAGDLRPFVVVNGRLLMVYVRLWWFPGGL